MWLRLMTRLGPLVALLAFLTPDPVAAVSEYQGEVVLVLDGDTIEVLHNQHPERIRLPQSQQHPKERHDPLNREYGDAHILACYFAS